MLLYSEIAFCKLWECSPGNVEGPFYYRDRWNAVFCVLRSLYVYHSLSKRDPMKDRRSKKDVRQSPEPPVAAAAEQPIFGVDFSSVKVEDLTG